LVTGSPYFKDSLIEFFQYFAKRGVVLEGFRLAANPELAQLLNPKNETLTILSFESPMKPEGLDEEVLGFFIKVAKLLEAKQFGVIDSHVVKNPGFYEVFSTRDLIAKVDEMAHFQRESAPTKSRLLGILESNFILGLKVIQDALAPKSSEIDPRLRSLVEAIDWKALGFEIEMERIIK
jgi:hypothetical protein